MLDADGVFVDSYDIHVEFCMDMAKQINRQITPLSFHEFREYILNGGRVSPMSKFLKLVGFTDDEVRWADYKYETIFGKQYYNRCPLYPAVIPALNALQADFTLGICSSNQLSNIHSILYEHEILNYFHSDLIFAKDGNADFDKGDVLSRMIGRYDLHNENVWFVGDQVSDCAAAHQANCEFIAAVYGWGLRDNGKYNTIRQFFDLVSFNFDGAKEIVW